MTGYVLGGIALGLYLTLGWLLRALARADEAARAWLPLPRWLHAVGDL